MAILITSSHNNIRQNMEKVSKVHITVNLGAKVKYPLKRTKPNKNVHNVYCRPAIRLSSKELFTLDALVCGPTNKQTNKQTNKRYESAEMSLNKELTTANNI
jgi:hypothetical protein